jgi:ADP-ribosyl-[dinitrogen reductase] hydrolase
MIDVRNRSESQRDRAVGSLLGLAVGDALGATLEFTSRDSKAPVLDLVGGGPFDLKPGEWTDDTSMALCLADSLIACGGFNPEDLLSRFVLWWRQGANSVNGICFDIGNTTSASLRRFEQTGRVTAGPEDQRQAGNGSLMRLAPVAIFAAGDHSEAERLAELQSRTTHPAPIAHEACRLFARKLSLAICGAGKDEVLLPVEWTGSPEINDIARGGWRGKDRDGISSSGYVVHTLEAALWCIGQCDDFEDAVILAANLADDSDTVAAVAGQLAGAVWGHRSIPERWLETLAWREHLIERAEALLDAGWRRIGLDPYGA